RAIVGLATALKLKPPGSHRVAYSPPPTEAPRCMSFKDCGAGEVCTKGQVAGTPLRGPRCYQPSRATCARGGNAFRHADSKCPKREWCSMYGVCFPKSEFPVQGRHLGAGARCYLHQECASGHCQSVGMDRFAEHVGSCTR